MPPRVTVSSSHFPIRQLRSPPPRRHPQPCRRHAIAPIFLTWIPSVLKNPSVEPAPVHGPVVGHRRSTVAAWSSAIPIPIPIPVPSRPASPL
uniref:Uncharacterized protein n=1 Tax=Arundo donax TaxID=35708 RepID=A0A0A9AW03_ARUDO